MTTYRHGVLSCSHGSRILLKARYARCGQALFNSCPMRQHVHLEGEGMASCMHAAMHV